MHLECFKNSMNSNSMKQITFVCPAKSQFILCTISMFAHADTKKLKAVSAC
jgi:hypothetical protein